MANQPKITTRRLSRIEAKIFSEEIRCTPNITGYTTAELIRLVNVLVLEKNREAVGIFVYAEGQTYIDAKILIIREKFRGNGYGKLLFGEAMKQLNARQKPVYTVTKNPVIIRMVMQAEFTQVSFFQLPLACMLHQARMVFSVYRIRESIRKYFAFPHGQRFSYWIKNNPTPL